MFRRAGAARVQLKVRKTQEKPRTTPDAVMIIHNLSARWRRSKTKTVRVVVSIFQNNPRTVTRAARNHPFGPIRIRLVWSGLIAYINFSYSLSFSLCAGEFVGDILHRDKELSSKGTHPVYSRDEYQVEYNNNNNNQDSAKDGEVRFGLGWINTAFGTAFLYLNETVSREIILNQLSHHSKLGLFMEVFKFN